MKQTVVFNDFVEAFNRYNRIDNFSMDGLRALFDYLERLEEDTGEEIELDVIGLCCDYEEYENFREIKQELNVDTMDELEYHTNVIQIDEGGYIIRKF